ncbi:MAG TPA: HPF/RaiA family ribosome-associated protein [Longimicrobiales bacterium]|nr:HPF/RaiA family ribosome-associated protein [Longimicrobiales bacterium]
MRVQITARKCDVPSAAQDRATSLIQKLQKYDSDILSAELVFEEGRRSREIEGILSIARSEPVVATGSGDDFMSAADDLSDKLAKILRRRRSMIRDRARTGAGEPAGD